MFDTNHSLSCEPIEEVFPVLPFVLENSSILNVSRNLENAGPSVHRSNEVLLACCAICSCFPWDISTVVQ